MTDPKTYAGYDRKLLHTIAPDAEAIDDLCDLIDALEGALRIIAGAPDTGMGVHRPCCMRAQLARGALRTLEPKP